MSRNYDNWERLVVVVLRREQLRRMARNSSTVTDYDSSSSTSSSSSISPPPDLGHRLSSPELDAMDDDHTGERFLPPGVPFFLTVESKDITISCGENSEQPEWIFSKDSSSLRLVAKIDSVKLLDIRGKMKTRIMTPKTVYGAYLVYKLEGRFKGPAKAMIRFVDDETDGDAENRADIVHLQQVDSRVGAMAVRRTDGWVEVRLGEFYVGDQDDREVEARLMEKTQWKTGLVVEGIEFRPAIVSEQSIPNTMEAEQPAENEESEDMEIDISLLQQFLPPSPALIPNPDAPSWHNWLSENAKVEGLDVHSNLRPESHHGVRHKEGTSSHHIDTRPDDTTPSANVNTFCPDWNLTNNSSLQEQGVGEEMMSKLLLPEDDRALSSLTQDEIFSGGYGCLSEAVYFFHGMKKLINQKEREINDLKYKLLKCDIDAKFVLGAKDSELEELRKTVEASKVNIAKCEERAKVNERKADERIKEVEQKLVNAEARAAMAVEKYRNSEEFKVEKHKFASRAFSIGFELCKRQVLEIDPGFDIRRIDVQSIEAAAAESTS